MDNATKAVSAKVAEAIEARGQTQLGVSEATGIPRTTLLRRLAGITPFTVAELAAIASVLDVDVVEFFNEPAATEAAS